MISLHANETTKQFVVVCNFRSFANAIHTMLLPNRMQIDKTTKVVHSMARSLGETSPQGFPIPGDPVVLFIFSDHGKYL